MKLILLIKRFLRYFRVRKVYTGRDYKVFIGGVPLEKFRGTYSIEQEIPPLNALGQLEVIEFPDEVVTINGVRK